MKGLTGAILIVVMVFAGPAFAQFYKYIDQRGNVRFTDDINQVPRDQRVATQSYPEAQASDKPAAEASSAIKKEEKPADPEPPAASARTAAEGNDSIESTRARIDALKKEVEAEYQVLLKETDRLAKEKEGQKTREETNAYNKGVAAFNQQAESFEKKNSELRKLAEEYNARVTEANSKTAAAPKK
jgi:hypothetical protein